MAEEQVKSGSKKVEKRPFRWSSELIKELIDILLDYKNKCAYNNTDFDADKTTQYQHIRKEMAKIHPEFFGLPEETAPFKPVCEMTADEKAAYGKQSKEERKLIKTGYTRIQQKVKETRQSFSKAVITGSRSGSGKLVCEHYETLKLIWGGSPNIEPLSCGIDSTEIQETAEGPSSLKEGEDYTDDPIIYDGESLELEGTESAVQATPTSIVPKLIDRKRKHMERALSAAGRDSVLMEDAKEDKKFRREMAEAMKASAASFGEALGTVSASMMQISNSLSRSMEIIAQSLQQPHQPFSYQPQYEQNAPPHFLHQRNFTEGRGSQRTAARSFRSILDLDEQNCDL